MNELLAFSGIVVALAIGAASPGPSFLMIARTAVSSGRKAGLAAALGMGLGGLLFATLALLGLTALLTAVPWLYAALKVGGGVYLLYLGIKIWRGAKAPLIEVGADVTAAAQAGWKAQLALGFGTQISNPKTAIVYGSVFAAFMPSTPALHFSIAVLLATLLIEAGWYAIVATVLSTPKSRQAYLRYKQWVDRSAGAVMAALGIKLALSANAQ
ncbi:LysE family translocator [Hylemonella gracilis]|uniref:Lysine exporter (LYSE/YGGA) n=1 Tax=Hylemonella gracilis ATCC 19624 TaxID=887062 RepID=F3KX81_9BURK|nr:LysE family transporter [Hylemonella gracilis]EGI75615.1 lysine exporter (LYSE/YGGA) [Hylemonella gracilis ATCC 19624]